MRVSIVPFFPKEALKNTSTAIQNLILGIVFNRKNCKKIEILF